MTRKKSKVKALALAVTCAILAGGYSSVGTVYAADATYDNITVSGNITAAGGKITAGFFDNVNKIRLVDATTNTKYMIDLIAGDSGGIEVSGKNSVGNRLTTKLGTDGIIYSDKGIKVGGAKTAFSVTVDNGAGNVMATGTLSVAKNKFSIDANGAISAAGGNFKVGENTMNLGYLKITATNDGITFADMNRTYADGSPVNVITISDMKTASDNTKGIKRYDENDRLGTSRKVTSIESQVKIRDDGRVEINTTGSNSEQSVVIDSGAGILVGHQDQVKKLLDKDSTVTAEQKEAYLNKTAGISYDGVFAGGIKFDEAKAGMSNVDGSLKAASGKFKVNADGSISAANNAFSVDDMGTVTGANASSLGSVGFSDGKIYSTNDDSKKVAVSDLITDHNIVNDAESGNIVLDRRMTYVEGQTKGVERLSKDVGGTTIHSTAVEGTLEVYDNGTVIINEGADQQVTIDSNGIKVGKNSSRMNDITGFATSKNLYVGTTDADNPTEANSKFYVKGDDGSVKAADGKFTVDADGAVSAAGKMKSKTLSAGTNGDEFTVDENGNVVAKGTLQTTGDISTDGKIAAKGSLSAANGKFAVDTDGTVSVGTDKFTVDGATGNTTVGGTLTVAGDTTLGSNLSVTGNATVGGTLGVTGNATVDGTLNSKGNFSVGTNNEFTVDATNGNVVSKGSLTSSSATIGTVGITNTGVITGVSSLTTDALIVNGALNINGDITGKNISGDSLSVTGNGTIGGSLGVTGAITGATINGATITTDSFNGATIKSNKFNGVTLDNNGNISGQDINASGNINANGTINGATITNNSFNGVTMTSGNVTGATITGTTITDGAGASMNAGTVKGTTITDGNGFTATGGNVSAKDVNATGTVTGTTLTDGIAKMNGGKVTAQNGLEVDANNYLNSSGLKASNIDASKATIGKIKIEGSQITSTEADGTVGLAGVTVNNAGALNNVTSIDGVAVSGSAASGLTVGAGATAVTIGGNSMALSSTNFGVDNDGDVTGQSFTAGNSYLKDGELKLNDATIWTTAEGIKAEKAAIGANTLDSTGFSTTGTLDVAGKATFGSNAANRTTIEQGAVSITQNGKTTTIKGGEIETDKLTVNDIVLKNSMKDGAGNTITISGTDGSLSVAGGRFKVDEFGQVTNEYTTTDGEGNHIKTSFKTSQDGINADYSNAVNGNHNLLAIDKDGVSLGVTDATNQKLGGFAVNKDNASLSYGANNSIVVDANTIKSTLGSDVSTTMTNNGADQSIVNKVTDNATSTIKADSIVNKVGSAKRSLKADEIVDEAAGMTVKTNADGTLFTNGTNSTLINGSRITSQNGTATGVLDGSNLTLTDGTNKTELTAGDATFTGAAGENGGKTTTINGGTITTDTLNVERINLGGELYDKNGTAIGGNLSMDKDGNFSAAGGNFKVIGGSGADKGAMTNTVGNTTLKTDTNGAGMSYAGTVTDADGNTSNVTSNVSVGKNNANVSAGAGSIDVTNESITSKVGTDVSSTIEADKIVDKVGNNSVTTDANGTTFNNGTNKTTINGGTITTGKLITDVLVITGTGDAAGDGSGSLAFGGNGTIKSDVKDGAKNTKFTTDINGVTTSVTDGTNTTTNEVAATGNNNTVTDGTATSKNTQTATSIGGVVTNGTVKIAQTLDGENGNITNEVTDKDGKSSKLVQNGTGLEYTDSANTENATRINSSDVSIGSATDDSKRINLSDLGQIDDLDSELSARDEFTSNKTAVGGINAEAAVRREEVARLDNRIDDVNNRVDKVGAMAAAIASLKSIGYDPQAPSEFSVGLGQYKGETGVALGFFHYPNKNFMINVSLSTAGGETMGGIGATWRFGHKSPQKLLDEQREAQARKELAAAEKYKAAAQLAKEAQERAEYAAKLARQAQVSADNAKAAADATQAKHFNK